MTRKCIVKNSLCIERGICLQTTTHKNNDGVLIWLNLIIKQQMINTKRFFLVFEIFTLLEIDVEKKQIGDETSTVNLSHQQGEERNSVTALNRLRVITHIQFIRKR